MAHVGVLYPMTDSTQAARMARQIAFVLEIDKLKTILRRTYLLDGSRNENTAEHSWQLGVMAIVLAEHSNQALDTLRTLKMLLVHDIVEIDAGDTYIYDAVGNEGKAAREQDAARRIFGLLPADQQSELHALWQEFEARETPEARFAAALDRLMPLLHNIHTQGRSWQEHGIHAGQVLARNSHIDDGSHALWDYAQGLIQDAVARHILAPDTA